MAFEYKSPLAEDDYHDEQSRSYKRTYRLHPYFSGPGSSRPPHLQEHCRPSGSNQRSSTIPKYSERFKTSQSLPPELSNMFGALQCRLCGLEASSPIVAKMHYSGKPHAKKVKQYMADYCKRNGIDVLEPDTSIYAQPAVLLPDFCEVCDVRLISLNDKVLHYSGKNHQKNIHDPNNAKKKKKAYDTIDIGGRFGIGQDFKGIESALSTDNITITGTANNKVFQCDLCDVKAVSHEQLQAHLLGKKHKEKMLKQENKDDVPIPDKPFHCTLCNVSLETKTLFDLHLNGKSHMKNVSKEKIKGFESCNLCSVQFTSIEHYKMHIEGKKHKKKVDSLSQKTKCTEQGKKLSVVCEFCPFVGNLEEHCCDESLLTIDHENLETKFLCSYCNMVLDNEEEFTNHKASRRHIMCALNKDGDTMIEELSYWYCYICRRQYRSNKEYTAHLFQETHKNLSKEEELLLNGKAEIFECTVCDIRMDKLASDEHMTSENHYKRCLEKRNLEMIVEVANEDTQSYQCSDCFKTFDNFIMYSAHILNNSQGIVCCNQ